VILAAHHLFRRPDRLRRFRIRMRRSIHRAIPRHPRGRRCL